MRVTVMNQHNLPHVRNALRVLSSTEEWAKVRDLFPDVPANRRQHFTAHFLRPLVRRGVIEVNGQGPARVYRLMGEFRGEVAALVKSPPPEIEAFLDPNPEPPIEADGPVPIEEEDSTDVALLLAERIRQMTDAIVSMNDRLDALSATRSNESLTRLELEQVIAARDEALATDMVEALKEFRKEIRSGIGENIDTMATTMQEVGTLIRQALDNQTKEVSGAMNLIMTGTDRRLDQMTEDIRDLLKTVGVAVAGLASEERTSRQLLREQLKREAPPPRSSPLLSILPVKEK